MYLWIGLNFLELFENHEKGRWGSLEVNGDTGYDVFTSPVAEIAAAGMAFEPCYHRCNGPNADATHLMHQG